MKDHNLSGERRLHQLGYRFIAGADEAGRGPLAGPLYAAMVVFPEGYSNPLLDDSKKLTEKQREALFDVIKEEALAYSIVRIGVDEVDDLNVYEASRRAMYLAYDGLNLCPIDYVVTDCMPLPLLKIPHEHPPKADATYQCVAAASILAKVSRDREMVELDKKHPGYGFAKNKGYGTAEHLKSLDELGIIEGVHRKSFDPVRKILDKDLLLF